MAGRLHRWFLMMTASFNSFHLTGWPDRPRNVNRGRSDTARIDRNPDVGGGALCDLISLAEAYGQSAERCHKARRARPAMDVSSPARPVDIPQSFAAL